MDYTDRRLTQTADQYAADDLETRREAKRYAEPLFQLFKPHVGRIIDRIAANVGFVATLTLMR